MTPDCTDFDQNSLDIFIKCKANILNVCNQCVNKKEQDPKTDQKNDSTKIYTQIVEIKDQMKTLTENITKSNALIETVKLELNEVKKTKPQNFAASLDAVKMGKKIDTPPPVRTSSNLGVRIRGVPENTTETPDERFQADIKAVEKRLMFLNIDEK